MSNSDYRVIDRFSDLAGTIATVQFPIISGLEAGTYLNASVTIDTTGRVTAITAGSDTGMEIGGLITGATPGDLLVVDSTGRLGQVTSIAENQVSGLSNDLAAKAVDSDVVHKTGDETIAGIKTFSSTIVCNVTGNAGTATNGVVTTGSYADPGWITSLAGSKITGNIAGNAASITGAITEAQVTGLTADLGAKAPLVSPAFTGTASVQSDGTHDAFRMMDSSSTLLAGIDKNGRIYAGGLADPAILSNIKIISSDPTDAYFGAAVGPRICWLEYWNDGVTPGTNIGIVDAYDYSALAGRPLHFGLNAIYTASTPNLTCVWKASQTGGFEIAPALTGFSVPGIGVTRATIHRIAGQTAPMLLLVDENGNTLGQFGPSGALSLPTLADASAPNGSLYLGSDHLDTNSAPKLCRKDASGNVNVIG